MSESRESRKGSAIDKGFGSRRALSGEQYRAMIETAEEGVWLIDCDARTAFVNRRMAEMLGYGVAEMLGRSLYEFMDGDTQADAAFEFGGRRDARTRRDLRLRRKDGTEVWAAVSATPLIGERGRFTGALGMVSDITERKQMEADLKQRHLLLGEAQRLAQLGSWHWDLRTDALTFSESLLDICGLASEQAPRSFADLLELVHPEDRERVHQATAKALRERASFSIDARVVRPDGSIRHLATRGDVQTDSCRTPAGLIGTSRDVTEQKDQERAHLESTESLRLLIENVVDCAIFMVSPTGHIMTWNEGARRISGHGDEILGTHISCFYPERARARGAPGRDLERARTEGRAASEDWRMRKDGTRFWASVVMTPLYDSAGALRGYGNVTRDLSERKLHEDRRDAYVRRMKDLSQRLVQAQDADRRRLATEVQETLGQSLAALKLHLQQALSQTRNGTSSRLRTSLDLADEAIEQVRSLSLDRHPLMLHDLGLRAALSWHLNSQVRATGIKVKFAAKDIPANLPEPLATTCFRVAQEAIDNTLKHSGATSISITVAVHNRHLTLSVCDNGRGFDTVTKTDSPSETSRFGLLGMRERTQALGGDVEIVSTPRKGTTVLLSLPLPPEDVRASSPAP